MAKAMKCDICGVFYDRYETDSINRYTPNTIKIFGTREGTPTIGETLDCCPTCMSIIRDLIKSLSPKEEEKDDQTTDSILDS